jgi:hypothetical protein
MKLILGWRDSRRGSPAASKHLDDAIGAAGGARRRAGLKTGGDDRGGRASPRI